MAKGEMKLSPSQIEKLYDKFRQTPTPVEIYPEDAERLLRAYGFVPRQPPGGGGHIIYVHPELGNFGLSLSGHRGRLPKGYVLATAEAVDRVRELYGGN